MHHHFRRFVRYPRSSTVPALPQACQEAGRLSWQHSFLSRHYVIHSGHLSYGGCTHPSAQTKGSLQANLFRTLCTPWCALWARAVLTLCAVDAHAFASWAFEGRARQQRYTSLAKLAVRCVPTRCICYHLDLKILRFVRSVSLFQDVSGREYQRTSPE